MTKASQGQVTASAAEIYEEFFLPALFQSWPPRLIAAADVKPGQRVLDVACGTGVLARALADRVHPGGFVVGLDINDGMLAVAQQKAPEIEWVAGRAEALPFADASFNAVLSQFGLMFFEDRKGAVREMARVLRPGGPLAVAVWDRREHSPGYEAMATLLQRLFGDEAAESLAAPFALGDPDEFQALFEGAGLDDVTLTTHDGTARFPSIESWVFTDVKGWTASDLIDDAGFERLLAEAERELQRFVAPNGEVFFNAPAHIVTAIKPG